jgi:hypothetical protein
LRYRFDVYHYGPFCAGVFNDVDWLTIMEVVEDKSANPEKFSNYRVTTSARDYLEHHREQVEPYRERIRIVCEALIPLSPEELELVSTLDYAFRELRARKKANPARDEVVNRFVEFKGEKFPKNQVEELFDRLNKVGAF